MQHQHIVHMENIKYKVVNLSSLKYTDYFYQSLSIIKQLNSDNVYSLYTIYMSVLLSSALYGCIAYLQNIRYIKTPTEK